MENELRSYSLRLLGRRDYSRTELSRKLLASYKLRSNKNKNRAKNIAKNTDSTNNSEDVDANSNISKNEVEKIIESILDELADLGYQSDQKFAAAYIRQAIQKGWGPVKIKHKLYQKGVADDTISTELSNDDDFWLAKAADTASKYYVFPLKTIEEKTKCYNFLLSRGFYSSHASKIINQK